MSSYNVTKVTTVGNRALLIVVGSDGTPMVSVYDEHEGQTLVRMCTATLENLRYALGVLENGEL